MRRSATKFGPDAAFENAMQKCFGTMKFKSKDGTLVEHWVCKRCPEEEATHQLNSSSAGSRKRAHILGGQFAITQRIKPCAGISEQEREKFNALYQKCARSSKKQKIANEQNINHTTTNLNDNLEAESTQLPIGIFMKPTESTQLCDNSLTEFFLDCGIPLHHSNHPALQKFVNHVRSAPGTYNLPCPKKISGVLLNNIYDKTCEEVQDALKSLKNGKIGLTLCHDGGNNVNEDPLCNVIVGSPQGYAFLESKTCESKTGQGIAEVLDKSVCVNSSLTWKDINFVTSDNAANCLTAVDILELQYPHISHIPCHLHVGGLIFKDIIDELDWYQELVDTMRKIIHVVSRHYQIKQLYEEISKDDSDACGVKLIKPSNTRIATGFFVAERIFRCENVLRALVAHPKFKNWLTKEKRKEVRERAQFVSEQIQKDDHGFWEKIQGRQQTIFC